MFTNFSKSTLVLLLLLAVSVFSMTACKKDDEKSPQDKLTAASCWKQTKQELLNSVTKIWESEPIDDCTKDDCITFKTDQTTLYDDGAVKCDPGDPQTSTGTWSLSADGKTLTVTDSGDVTVATILELTDNKLVLELDVEYRVTLTR